MVMSSKYKFEMIHTVYAAISMVFKYYFVVTMKNENDQTFSNF